MTTSTTPSPLDAPAADPRPIFARAVALGTAVIGAVQPGQLDGATPCPDLTVRQLVGHLVGVLHRVEAIGLGTNPLAVPAMVDDVADQDWSHAWATAAQRAEAAFADDAALARMVELPWRVANGADQLCGYVTEVTVHTWDLAQATGQQPAWDPAVVEVALAGARATLPVAERAELFEAVFAKLPPGMPVPPPAFADAVAVEPDASAIDQLVAWYGRRP